MPRIYLSARGEPVDFDAIIIKQKLAQAPMDIEVARRKNLIDSKEEKAPRKSFILAAPEGMVDNYVSASHEVTREFILPTDAEAIASVAPVRPVSASDFEIEGSTGGSRIDGPVPNLPVRGKK